MLPLCGMRMSLATVADHQAVAADEAEHAGQHLVAAGAVVAVDQDDLVGFGQAP